MLELDTNIQVNSGLNKVIKELPLGAFLLFYRNQSGSSVMPFVYNLDLMQQCTLNNFDFSGSTSTLYKYTFHGGTKAVNIFLTVCHSYSDDDAYRWDYDRLTNSFNYIGYSVPPARTSLNAGIDSIEANAYVWDFENQQWRSKTGDKLLGTIHAFGFNITTTSATWSNPGNPWGFSVQNIPVSSGIQTIYKHRLFSLDPKILILANDTFDSAISISSLGEIKKLPFVDLKINYHIMYQVNSIQYSPMVRLNNQEYSEKPINTNYLDIYSVNIDTHTIINNSYHLQNYIPIFNNQIQSNSELTTTISNMKIGNGYFYSDVSPIIAQNSFLSRAGQVMHYFDKNNQQLYIFEKQFDKVRIEISGESTDLNDGTWWIKANDN